MLPHVPSGCMQSGNKHKQWTRAVTCSLQSMLAYTSPIKLQIWFQITSQRELHSEVLPWSNSVWSFPGYSMFMSAPLIPWIYHSCQIIHFSYEMTVKTVHNSIILSKVLDIAFSKIIFYATLWELCWPKVIIILQLTYMFHNTHEQSSMFLKKLNVQSYFFCIKLVLEHDFTINCLCVLNLYWDHGQKSHAQWGWQCLRLHLLSTVVLSSCICH
jgi:hypothetical protein